MALTKVRGSGLGTLGDGTANDTAIVFDGNAQDFHIGLDDSADSLTLGLGSALGTTSHMVFDANGQITKPLQPAFLAQPTSLQSNIALDTWVTVVFGTERYDINGDFASNTFTAPVTGKYIFTVGLDVRSLDSGADAYYIALESSNRAYYTWYNPNDTLAADASGLHHSVNAVADMDASDTINVKFHQVGGTQQTDISTDSFFSGMLIG